ncbi:MAG: thiamine-phosphate kinase [Nitrospirota bacterium]
MKSHKHRERVPYAGEFALIDRIARRQQTAQNAPDVLLGIGDDAAAVRISPGKKALLTTDILIEKTHFDLSFSTFFDVGYKALSVNLSDIAAMGGRPRFFLVSLGLTGRESLRDIDQLYRGIKKASQEAGTVLIGGNTACSRALFFVSITLLGEAPKKEIVTRGGGKPGDYLYVTGTLGDSASGLDLLKKGIASSQKLVLKHKRPKARFLEGYLLGQNKIPSAMIDLSDGLSSDLSHLAKASGVGVELEEDKIPISASLKLYGQLAGVNTMAYALNGGEDYELLFSVPKNRIKKLNALIQKGTLFATPIGRLTEKIKGLLVKKEDGTTYKLQRLGYDHCKAITN